MSGEQAITLSDATNIGKLHYLRYKVAAGYADRIEFNVQVSYAEQRLTPAFVRQAAREVAAGIMRIADEMEKAPLPGVER